MIPPPTDSKVIAFQKEDDKTTPIIAIYIPRFYREIDHGRDELDSEYSYATNRYYWLCGWYECVNNWGDISYLRVIPQCNIMSWQPINYPA